MQQSSDKSAPPSAVRCLVSGFDAFAHFNFNPSQWVAERLPSEISFEDLTEHLEIAKSVVPTCCEDSWRLIHEQLSAREFDILLALGLAGERPRITLERFALNIRDYFGNKDNLGHSWRGQYIELGGPEALRTNVPLLELEEHLTELGFLVGVSNYAGSFVCNEVYYRAMAYQQSHARLKYVLFMHLPEPENLAKTLMQAGNSDFGTLNSEAERKQKALDIMFNAVIKTIVFLGRKVIAPDGEAFA